MSAARAANHKTDASHNPALATREDGLRFAVIIEHAFAVAGASWTKLYLPWSSDPASRGLMFFILWAHAMGQTRNGVNRLVSVTVSLRYNSLNSDS